MVDSPKPRRDAIAALLNLSVDLEEGEEAENELRAMGVDVDGFVARARERRAQHEEKERTAWRTAARAELSKAPRRVSAKYTSMGHAELLREFQGRRQQEAHAFFHKLDEINDDDLRTLLTDLDELDDGQEDQT